MTKQSNGLVFWIRVRNRHTNEVLYEYESVFTDVDEAVEDVYRMIGEGRLPYLYLGYLVEIFDTHPDALGVRKIATRKI